MFILRKHYDLLFPSASEVHRHLSRTKVYICPRCEAAYSAEEYIESLFCRGCGSFLRKNYVAARKLYRRAEDKEKSGPKRFFPYIDFRPYQHDAIDFVYQVIKNRKIGMLSSPCGTGKSVSVLTAFFLAKEQDDSIGRLFALTRTKNQLEIYCRELKNIKRHSGVNFVASIFKSKKEMCPCIRKNARLRHIKYRDFLQYCRTMKSGTFGKNCKYFERTYKGRRLSWHANRVISRIKSAGPLLPEEVYKICYDEGLCPYEVTKVLAKYADIIVGSYNYILLDSVRESIFRGTGIKTEEVNCVFDEAHSLPDYAADILSDELASTTVLAAKREAETFAIDDSQFAESLHHVLTQLGENVYKSLGSDVEHVIETREVVDLLLNDMDTDLDGLTELLSELSDMGEIIRQKKAEAGKNPISYLGRCATFVQDWVDGANSSYARYLRVTDEQGWERIRLGIKCLDPALAAAMINGLRSAVLMSGTLWNRDYYIDALGIERNRCESLELPSPFPRKNRLIAVDTSVTTKFERRSEAQWRRIADHLEKIVSLVNGRIAVYFPSYAIMHEVVETVHFDAPFLVEKRDTKIIEVLQFLKTHKHCVVFGVARGKISEGVDMSLHGKSLLAAVIAVGLPYPKRTELQAALIRYFGEKFGSKAIEYAIGIPCLSALAQSTGRLLRNPQDKGIILILDRRAAGRFKEKFPQDWRKDMKAYYSIENILKKIREFTCRKVSIL